jgi:hypothetical protein
MTDKDQEKKKFSLLISSAFYEVKAYSPYITSLVNSIRLLQTANIDWSYQQISGDSYVDRAKNSLVHHFLKSDFSHMMIIDSDESWDVSGFGRLIKGAIAGAEVIAGLYPCKNNWDFYGGVAMYSDDGYVMGKEINNMRLVEMQIAPGGFIIYSREAFERTRLNLNTYVDPETNEEILEAFKCNIELERPKKSRHDLKAMSKEDLVAEVLDIQHGGQVGKRIGEDIYFQQRYKEMGGKIWCEPNIDMGHFGVKEWKGNYQNWLLDQSKKADAQKNQDEIQSKMDNISANLKKLKDKKLINA